MHEDAASSSSEGYEDPEPVCKPPAWAADLVADARARAGQGVYPPSDDTFLLLEALAADRARLRALRPRICVEVCCGTGVVLVGLHAVLQGCCGTDDAPGAALEEGSAAADAFLLAVDKSPVATACAEGLLRAQGLGRTAVVQGDLGTPLRLGNAVDVGVCNPPYVPTPSEEMSGYGIQISWAGGNRGREVIDRLLPQIAELLAPGGLFYLVCMAENDPEEIMETVRKQGLLASLARRERRGVEDLSILRFERPLR